MTGSQPDNEAIFHAARDIANPERRREYVRDACGRDEARIAHVAALLAAADTRDSLLDRPAVSDAMPTSDQPTTGLGTVIGPYKLVEQIGEGGMGTVWMAQQSEPVKRLVALKLIKAGMDSRQVIARLEAERQALALMDHPNIARVLDGGTTDAGRPYFVMDLVRGVPITRYCDEHHLTPRERLELFIPVCQAIQHAHQKGIIHRDLKPTNVLVALYDGQPVPKVIDFGVAKAAGQPLTEQTLVTGFGAIVGTLEYMSPEQAEINQLDIDTRSDIYSLGVLLYELLTGSTPLDKSRLRSAAFDEMLRIIREEEPSKPSTKLSTAEGLPTLAANRGNEPAKLTKLIRGELDWIVMKALEKDRSRRYETANGFAVDVQRYLAGEPVQAVPPSAGYRLRKFARRNKGPLAAAGVLVVALLAVFGAVAGSVGWAFRDRAARQASVESSAVSLLDEAEKLQLRQQWREALETTKQADRVLAGEGSQELLERIRLLRRDLEMAVRLETIPLRMKREIEFKGNWDEPEIKGNWGYASVASAYAEAFSSYGVDVLSLSLEDAVARIRSRPGVAPALIAALDKWAYLPGNSQDEFRVLLDVAHVADSDPWRREVREAMGRKDGARLAELASSPELLNQPPASATLLSSILKSLGQEKAHLDVLRRAQQKHPDNFWLNWELAIHLVDQVPHDAPLDKVLPQAVEAIGFCRAAYALRPDAEPNTMACILLIGGQSEKAEYYAQKHLELNRTSALAHFRLGFILQRTGKIDEAIAPLERAIELKPAGIYHRVLGTCLKDQKRWGEASVHFRNAIEFNPKDAYSYADLGHCLGQQGDYKSAVANISEALKIFPNGSPGGLAYWQYKDGQLEESVRNYRKAIELYPTRTKQYLALSEVLLKLHRRDEAAEVLLQAIKNGTDLPSETADIRRRYSIKLNNLAWHLATQTDPKARRPAVALEVAKEAVRIAPEHHWNTLGLASYRAGEYAAAIEAAEQALKVRDGGDSHNWLLLALAHGQLGHMDEARRWYDKSKEWMEKNKPDDHELLRFRAEAAELLKINEQ